MISVIHQHEVTVSVHMCCPSLSLPPPIHSHPPRLLQSPSLSFLSHRANSHQLSIYLCYSICIHSTFFIHLTLSLLTPTLVQKSVLYIYVSTAALQAGSSVPSLYIPYIFINIWYLFFSFWLTSLCLLGSRFIHLIRTDSNAFLFMVE